MRPILQVDNWFVGFDAYNGSKAFAGYTIIDGQMVFADQKNMVVFHPVREGVVMPLPTFYQNHTLLSGRVYELSEAFNAEGFFPGELYGTEKAVIKYLSSRGSQFHEDFQRLALLELWPCMRPAIWQVSQFLLWQEGEPAPRLLPKFSKHVLGLKDSYRQLAHERGPDVASGLATRLAVGLELQARRILPSVLPSTVERTLQIVEQVPSVKPHKVRFCGSIEKY